MLVEASTTPSATPYAAIPATNTGNSGASTSTGTATPMSSSPARSTRALSVERAARSASTEPTPASTTIISRISDSVTSLKSQRSRTSGSRVVSEMNTRPWVKKAAPSARRALPRAFGRSLSMG
jgi:hypothetical protein